MTRVLAAVVQAAPLAFDLTATLARLHERALAAAQEGAQLVVFPEAFVAGYPRGLDFGTRVGSRTPEGRAWFRRYWENAIAVPGPGTEAIGAAARAAEAFLVVGAIERDGGTLYCTVLFFDPAGRLLGKHRKVMPTAAERLVWGFGDGSTLPVLDTPLGRLGAVICWENYMPLLRMYMYSQNIQIYCAPTADCRETWLATMRHIALEGRCFVLSSNQFATRADYPEDYPAFPGVTPETVVCEGGSCIIDPLGRVLAGPAREGPAILYAELDLDAIAEAKFDLDVVGHYARPDLFRLIVDTRPKPPARTVARAARPEPSDPLFPET